MFRRRRKTAHGYTPAPAPGPAERDRIPADDAELMRSLRSRLYDVMADSVRDSQFAYSRRVGPLVEVLCRDLAEEVVPLTDAQLAGRDLDLLFAAARRNTELEPSDLSTIAFEGAGAVRLLEGDHYFVASQVGSLPARIAAEAGPSAVGEGLLVIAPRRGAAMAVAIIDETVMRGVGILFDFLERYGDGTGFHGLYFVHDPDISDLPGGGGFSDGPVIQDVRGPSGPDGTPGIIVSGPFADAMLRAELLPPEGMAGGDAGTGPTDG